MAAQAWKFYNQAKEYIGDGTLDLDTDVFYIALVQSSSNFATATLTAWGSVTNEVASGNGYSSSGKTLSATTWITGQSASERRFDATAAIWSASGGTIANVKAAVIFASGGQLLCYASLTSSQFTVSDGNTLTITPSANGIFELN